MYAEKTDYDDIEMSSRLRNVLRRNGFDSLEGLREYPKEHFIKFRNMGPATLQEVFLRNLLLNEQNELQNRNLHISGLLNEEKVDIECAKVDIEKKKVDIESILSAKGSDFSVKTTVHIHRLFEKFGFEGVFGRSAVMELLELKSSGASKLLSNLVQADIIEPVPGHGKGKYKFKK